MTTREGEAWISLPMPLDVSVSERRRFMKLARLLAAAAEPEDCLAIVRALPSTGDRATHAAVSVLGDLLVQGWDIRIGRGRIEVRPASSDGDPSLEKTREPGVSGRAEPADGMTAAGHDLAVMVAGILLASTLRPFLLENTRTLDAVNAGVLDRHLLESVRAAAAGMDAARAARLRAARSTGWSGRAAGVEG